MSDLAACDPPPIHLILRNVFISAQIPFELIVAHVDEGAACGLDQETGNSISERIWESVEGFVQTEKFTCLHLEDIFSSDLTHLGDRAITREERRQKLHTLIQVRRYLQVGLALIVRCMHGGLCR
jgi:hypothetical protein